MNDPVQKLRDKIESLLREQKWVEAIPVCDRLIGAATDSRAKSVGYCFRGMARLGLGEYDQALEDQTMAIEIDPTFASAYHNRGVFHYKIGEQDAALEDFNSAINLNPEYADAYLGRGVVHYEKGEYDPAIKDYSRAINLETASTKVSADASAPGLDLALAYESRGDAYHRKKEYALAITDYDKALELDPGRIATHYNRGLAYHKTGRLDRAIADYSEAIRHNPKHTSAYNSRGIAYSAQGEHDLAIADFNEAIKHAPGHADTYLNRGASYSMKGDYAQAIKDCDKAIELAPGDTHAYYNRGLAYSNEGEYDQAIEDLTQAMTHGMEEARAYHDRGIAYGCTRNYDRAIEDFTHAIGLGMESARAYHDRGLAYGGAKDYNLAIDDFTRAIELEPQSAAAYTARGVACSNKGDHDQAIADCGEAIELEPEYADAYYFRGSAFTEQQNYERAFCDLISADERDSSLRTPPTGTLVYIAVIANKICAKKEGKIALFELFFAIDKVREKLFLSADELASGEIAHYTSLCTLKSLTKKNAFRIYSAEGMDDKKEGRAFFDVMKAEFNFDVEEKFYRKNDGELHAAQAYIGSFVAVEPENTEKGEPFMWCKYGKRRTGACLVFKRGRFAPTPLSSIKAIFSWPVVYASLSEERKKVVSTPDDRPEIHRIVYVGRIGEKDARGESVLALLKELVVPLRRIETLFDRESPEIDLVRKMLDSVRFLFKADSYEQEKEVRVAEVLYRVDGEGQPERKVYKDQKLSRDYLKLSESVGFDRRIPGPLAWCVPKWWRWLKNEEPMILENLKTENGKSDD